MEIITERLSKPLMEVPWDVLGIFRSRSNRFSGIVDITNLDSFCGVKVHIHDPGRLSEILYPGNEILLKRVKSKNRVTEWDLIAGRCGRNWVLAHSGYHRRIAEVIIRDDKISPFGRAMNLSSEVTWGHSRIDFLIAKEDGTEVWVEVKGCTLAADSVALFPDAPTQRGSKHLKTLISLKKGGAHSALLILTFSPDAVRFAPNWLADPEFYFLFYQALDLGVEVYPVLLECKNGNIYFGGRVPVSEGDLRL